MLILKICAAWSIIAIFTTLLAGETLRRMGSAMPNRRLGVPALAVIARPARAGLTRRNNNAMRDSR
jgi:hypothetical protein